MINMSKTAKDKILEKHPPMTKEQEQAKIKQLEEEKLERTQKNINYEKNLLEYFERTKPILDGNGKTIALMRYPSYTELIDMIPAELRKYRANPKAMPLELMAKKEEKYADVQFNIIADMIVDPKHPADWWKRQKHIMGFVKLFTKAFQEIVEETGTEAMDFPEALKDKP